MNITVRTTEFDIEVNLDIRIEKHIVSIYWREYDWYYYGETISEALDKSQKLIMSTLENFEQASMLTQFLDKFNMKHKSLIRDGDPMMYTINTIG